MEKLIVNAASRLYDILIGPDHLGELGTAMKDRDMLRGGPVAVLTSPRIGALYYEPVRAGLEAAGAGEVGRCDVPDGEKNKNMHHYGKALSWLASFAPQSAARPLLVTLGGGVVGDLGGFVAATYRRGVEFVQVPTTLIAAVDSSVGGKVAVDLPEGKNLAGAFHQPSLVFIDLATLSTLPKREVRSGLAEVIKYGAALDAALFALLEKNICKLRALNAGVLAYVVLECCRLKAKVVAQDERDEKGVRVSLNFGHTFGHAIEAASNYRLRHGECVALGMAAAARVSERMGLCSAEDAQRLTTLIKRAGLPLDCKKLALEADSVLAAMRHDKKWTEGANRFVLLSGIGSWVEQRGVEEGLIREAVGEILA